MAKTIMSEKMQQYPLFTDKNFKPDFSEEQALKAKGFLSLAGVDEVGRGPLAGPVVTAAVILDEENIPQGLNDSKKLSVKQRDALYEEIMASAKAISIASLCAKTIDATNIRQAALDAMRRAVLSLSYAADYVLVDGRDIPPGLNCPAKALIKGDSRSVSIAAASIIAKVSRDKMMENIDPFYPEYGFKKHAGYATAVHRAAIEKLGAIAHIHRYSFAPIKGRFKDNT